MDLQESRIGVSQHQQSLRRGTVSGTARWLLCCLLVMLLCYCLMPSTPLFARSAAQTQDPPLVTQKIRYHMPDAGEVFLVWGINGWNVVPEEIRPAGTIVKDNVMHTLMVHEDDSFVARIQVPAGATIDYGFLITKNRSGTDIPAVWDGHQDYQTIAAKDDVLEVEAKTTLDQNGESPSMLDVGLPLLLGIGIVLGIGLVFTRTLRLRRNTLPKDARYSIRPYDAVKDCLFLSLVVLLSLILYVQDLGFYSDDWSFLGFLSMSADRSLFGLFRSIYSPHVRMRPVHILYLAGLYWLFGPQPLGYHLANAVVFLSNAVLFYLVLRELGQRRVIALAVPAVYALLPHYSTDRFWVVAFQATLSMALYFLSFYSDLRALRAPLARLWGWKLLSVMGLLGSALAYEVALPLFLLNPVLAWYRGRQLYGSTPDKRTLRTKLAILLAGNLLILVPVTTFKTLTTTRMGTQVGLTQQIVSIVKRAIVLGYDDYSYGLNFKRAVWINLGKYGLGLPRLVWRILRNYPDAAIVVTGVVLGLIVFAYLYHVVTKSDLELPSRTSSFGLAVLGSVVFVLGYAIFLTNYNVLFTAAGIGNRSAIAAAVGVALLWVGGLGWLSTYLPSQRLRRYFFCVLVVLLCVSGFLINNTIATFWVEAYRIEKQVLAEVYRQFPTLPEGSTLILDGVCPYIGPAIVFESNWDLAGALMMHYRDYDLRADVVMPNLKVEEDGLYTSLYDIEHHYPYGELLIYRFGWKKPFKLTDAEAARLYFQTFNPDYSNGCPRGYAGYGVPIF